ncbi:50S ribosomal protein L10 [Desulfatiglans anilini]|uniref:50S ribosomal protein L10 n=1 Tax=Desulfatiglans anilini TaxID=90728 RepID=UPI0004286F34|nr:50S ribosomal protein L10 [Desulfatiglans anilini]
MDKQKKEEFVTELQERLKKAQGSFLVNYQGLNVETLSKLRKELREAGGEVQVVKNRLLKLASRDTETECMEKYMTGPSAVVLSYEDVVKGAKALVEFGKTAKQFSIKGGQISGRVMDEEGIKRLADLPAREVLLSQVLAAMQAVPAGFVRVLNGVMVQFMNVLKAIEEQKGESA